MRSWAGAHHAPMVLQLPAAEAAMWRLTRRNAHAVHRPDLKVGHLASALLKRRC